MTTNKAESMVEFIKERLEAAADEAPVHSIRTYEEVGMLTRDAGLVVTMTDGTVYQVTVVTARVARG